MSYRTPISDLLRNWAIRTDIKSLTFLLVCCIVFLVLAYLTNPSENSFRAYLTEQSFRQHLSRLDDNVDDDSGIEEKHLNATIYRSVRLNAHSPLPFESRSPFHFANRAAVSLRTPKHVFHTFGIFTIAAMVPLTRKENHLRTCGDDISLVSDAWFIGAFGKWWRGGVLETWYRDVITRSYEESWSSGILGMKAMDRGANDFNGLPFTSKGFANGSTPSHQKSARRSNHPPSRNPSPPPLPISASLPLHASRPPSDNTKISVACAPKPQVIHPSDQAKLAPPTSSALFDQTPRAMELLRQISLSKASTIEMRTQLDDLEASANQSHSILQKELDALRGRKRLEDAVRNDLKARTRTLDDSKRYAEGVKRESEKRLKATQTARDEATSRIEYLDKEITILNQGVTDTSLVQEEITQNKHEIMNSLDRKKKEIRIAEDVVAALNLRARELEDKIALAKTKLFKAKEKIDSQEQNQEFILSNLHSGPYSPVEPPAESPVLEAPRTSHIETEASKHPPVSGILPPLQHRRSLDSCDSSPVSVPLENSSVAPQNGRLPICTTGFTANINNGPGFLPFDHHQTVPIRTSRSSTGAGLVSGTEERFSEEDNNAVDREGSLYHSPAPFALAHHSSDEYNPFEIRMVSLDRASIYPSSHDSFLAQNFTPNSTQENTQLLPLTKEKAKKGLNPDAKVFLSHKVTSANAAVASLPSLPSVNYDALNPNGLGSIAVPSSDATTFLRAFAPSPAEREALKRALGSSTNTSVERLPCLPNVSSNITSSSSHSLGYAAASTNVEGNDCPRAIPPWLQSFPNIHKSNFSPWDDDDSKGDLVGT